ncbi:hydrogenase nickel incorporation protein HypB [candidate division WOR-3 bacterium]|nr:hydrogenase nickel incorporation protein HypB [candidate division WOR-3 bacterium]
MKKIKVLHNVLAANDQVADTLRKELKKRSITLINVMGSPGSGKTSLIEKSIKELPERHFAVIEGDIETSLDAEKMSSLNVETFQINTGPFGGDCHLEASWVKSAVDSMSLKGVDLVFIENIGNLVCPAEFDTGAHINVVILSTPEGEDKPLKYPLMFRKSDVLVISKMDLVPHLNVNIETIIKNARGINPEILVFPLSTKTNEGVDKWVEYLRRV